MLIIDILKLQARHRELEIIRATERFEHRVQSEITNADLQSVSAELSLLKEQKASLIVKSKVAGQEERLAKLEKMLADQAVAKVEEPEPTPAPTSSRRKRVAKPAE